MKNLFFAFWIYLFFVGNIQIYAQKTEYKSVFGETNTSYNVLYSYDNSAAVICEATFNFLFNSDVIINGIEYKEFDVWVPNSCGPFCSYFLRESEDKSKLYALFSGEILLMDLNLNLHDTFNYGNYDLIVENIFYDEENVKHILFSPIKHSIEYGDNAHYQFEFIEGIGSTAIFGLESRIGILLCAHKDDINAFTNNSDFLPAHIRGKCFYEHWHVGVEDLFTSKDNLKIYPNPVSNFIIVDLDENFMNYQGIVVYDLLGKPCLNTAVTQAKQYINIQSLSTGNYIIKAIGKDKSMYGKFSIMR